MSDERRRAPIPPAQAPPPPTIPEKSPLFMAFLMADDSLQRAIDGFNCDSGVGVYGDYVAGQLERVMLACRAALLEIRRAQAVAGSAEPVGADEDSVDTPLVPPPAAADVQAEGGES